MGGKMQAFNVIMSVIFFLGVASALPGLEPTGLLKPEYVDARSMDTENATDTKFFVFLQKFPLGGVNLFFHTEVVVCPRSEFNATDQQFLDKQISGIGDKGFLQIDNDWWTQRTAACVELGYGGAMCKQECCGVPHTDKQKAYPMNSRDAVIGNADGKQKTMYVYGDGSFDGNQAWHNACDKKCWSIWAGTNYNPLTNNCNTFTSTILFCVYGLSQKKPNLGPSDMVTVKGHCPAALAAPAAEYCLHHEDIEDHKCMEACASGTFKTKGIDTAGHCPAKYSTIDHTVTQEQCPDGITNLRYCQATKLNVTVTTKGQAGQQRLVEEIGDPDTSIYCMNDPSKHPPYYCHVPPLPTSCTKDSECKSPWYDSWCQNKHNCKEVLPPTCTTDKDCQRKR